MQKVAMNCVETEQVVHTCGGTSLMMMWCGSQHAEIFSIDALFPLQSSA